MSSEANAGLLAEFESPEALYEALRGLRDDGYQQLEAYSPFSCDEVDAILDRTPSRMPLAILLGGLGGAGGGYFLEWLTNAYLMPLRIGGRPSHFPLAYVPISFEMGILGASLTAFLGVLIAGKLVRLWTPRSEVSAFATATNNGFWIAINARDQQFNAQATEARLWQLGAQGVNAFGHESLGVTR